jgi:hypothetical protein
LPSGKTVTIGSSNLGSTKIKKFSCVIYPCLKRIRTSGPEFIVHSQTAVFYSSAVRAYKYRGGFIRCDEGGLDGPALKQLR